MQQQQNMHNNNTQTRPYLSARMLSLTGLLLCLSTSVWALPEAFKANYSVASKGLALGNISSELNYHDNQYDYQRTTEATGLAALFSGDRLSEHSKGLVNETQFVTQQFEMHHKSKRKDRKDRFSRQADNQLQGAFDGNDYTLAAKARTIDTTIMPVQLMYDVQKKPKQAQFSYHVAEKGKLKTYTLKRVGTENLTLTAGQYQCDKFEVVRKDSEDKTTIWLAKELDYFPVRIRHNDDGDVLDSKLTNYQAKE
ncbi:MAG: DUF3108 domain-containing protein [bacterium]